MATTRFTLHESFYRALSRLAFVVLGAAPLLVCAYLCAATFVPGYYRRQAIGWEKELESRFGLSVRIQEARWLAPCQYRLTGIEFYLPNSQKLVGKLEEIDLQLGKESQWQIQLHKPEVQLDQLANASRIVQQFFLHNGAIPKPSVRLQSDRLKINDRQETIELANLQLSMYYQGEVGGLNATFQVVPAIGDLRTQPVNRLVVVRKQSSDETHDVGLDLKSAVSCYTLAKLFDLASQEKVFSSSAKLIQSCQFTGIIGTHTDGTKCNYYLRDAKLTQLDLSQLTLGQPLLSPDTMIGGMATLDKLNAIFDKSQLNLATGELQMGPGRIDRAFLQSIAQHLQITLPNPSPVRNVGFDRLAVAFSIRPQFMTLAGIGSQPGVMMEDAQGPLAWKAESTVPIMSLIQALVFRPDNPNLPARITPLVRTALVWLPLEDQQRKQAEIVLYR